MPGFGGMGMPPMQTPVIPGMLNMPQMNMPQVNNKMGMNVVNINIEPDQAPMNIPEQNEIHDLSWLIDNKQAFLEMDGDK